MAGNTGFDHQAFKQFEHDGYAAVAEGYAKFATRITTQAIGPLLDAAAISAGTILLDVACGPGFLTAAAMERGATATGLDQVENMLTLARARCPGAEFHREDAEAMPFDEGQFDAVICSFGILHFPDPEKAMAEACRVLKPGGRYALTAWLPPDRNPLFALVLGAVETHGNPDVGLPPGPDLFRFGNEDECKQALTAAVFRFGSVSELPMVATFARPEAIVEEILISTARISQVIKRQGSEQRKKIEAAITEGGRAFQRDGRVEIPMTALMVSAVKA